MLTDTQHALAVSPRPAASLCLFWETRGKGRANCALSPGPRALLGIQRRMGNTSNNLWAAQERVITRLHARRPWQPGLLSASGIPWLRDISTKPCPEYSFPQATLRIMGSGRVYVHVLSWTSLQSRLLQFRLEISTAPIHSLRDFRG